MSALVRLACLSFLVSLLSGPVSAAEWQAGVARANITPAETMWMSGYASRDHGADGKLTDLWAKAIVIDDPAGHRIAAVTLDLVGLDRPTSLAIRDGVEQKYGIPRSNIALFCSHTHTGPVVGSNLRSMFELDEAEGHKIDAYTAKLIDDVVRIVGEAVADLEPARLSWACGTATYAVNRRTNREPDVPMLREQGLLNGPVDHDVPVLSVRAGDKLKAVLFGYACHATVLDLYQWTGDHPGFAMLAVEEQYPGTQAMFWAGCGADQNPLPRRKVELAEKYGRQLAKAVSDVLDGAMHPISGELQTAYSEIDVGFAAIPTTEQLQQTLGSENRYERVRAGMLLKQIESSGSVAATYPYPVQSWKLGNGPLWVTLGGEVVVDFSLRLKTELGVDSTWVAGYANDVMAYIPSARVLQEGGYEGGGAMLYYGLPSAWADNVEDLIVAEAHRQAQSIAP
ncbi:MAG: neutral/alkaline non-lysosomal ceramidase N-terminal domain-containing protein [Planctomycetaceae bacterium]|nr:neutral/alkaline non-lysosomal ceramidase N-terminal domain-containing protein [Planctomycetaceae bacterium]